jgi:hypothetical protein
MARRTKYLGMRTAKSSDKILSPSKPYTGDGKTRRDPHDPVKVKNVIVDKK